MTTMASKITSITVVYSTVYSDADQRKHHSSASLAFVWGIHRDRWIPHTRPVTRKMFPFDDVIMKRLWAGIQSLGNCFREIKSWSKISIMATIVQAPNSNRSNRLPTLPVAWYHDLFMGMTWWRHDVETLFELLNFVKGVILWSPKDFPHKGTVIKCFDLLLFMSLSLMPYHCTNNSVPVLQHIHYDDVITGAIAS